VDASGYELSVFRTRFIRQTGQHTGFSFLSTEKRVRQVLQTYVGHSRCSSLLIGAVSFSPTDLVPSRFHSESPSRRA